MNSKERLKKKKQELLIQATENLSLKKEIDDLYSKHIAGMDILMKNSNENLGRLKREIEFFEKHGFWHDEGRK